MSPTMFFLAACYFLSLTQCTEASTGSASTSSSVLAYLQQESAAITAAQNSIQQFLHSKKIPVGLSPIAAKALRSSRNSNTSAHRVALSTGTNDITCRISLARVPEGRKCIAPCGCTGSQEWVQFTELNRLRRLEPSQWLLCQTCRRKFDYSSVRLYGGVVGNLLTIALDNLNAIRAAGAFTILTIYYLSNFNRVLLRLLTSKALWQQYPRWSRVTRLPLVLKLWFGKITVDYFAAAYLQLERVLIARLADIEATIVEERLPVTVTTDV